MAELSNRRSSDVIDIRRSVARWNKFYYPTLEGMYEEHKERFLSPESRLGPNLFVYRNEIRAIVDKRADAVPSQVKVSARDSGLEQWANDFLAARVFTDKSFVSVQSDWNRYLERTGNLILALVPDDVGVVHVQLLKTEDVDVLYNADNIDEIYGYEVKWTTQRKDEKGNTQSVSIEYRINQREYVKLIDNEIVWQMDNPWPFVPVVHIVAEEIEGRVMGESCIEHLIEPQLLINACLTDIRVANRLGAFPVLYGSLPVDGFYFAPGAYNQAEPNDKVDRVDTKTDITGLKDELAGHRRYLYDVGRVNPREDQEISKMGIMPSGKALLVLNQDGIVYVRNKMGRLAEAWGDLLAKAAVMVGKVKPADYVKSGGDLFDVSYGAIELDDPEQGLKEMAIADTLHTAGLVTDERYLQLAQLKGIVPREWDVAMLLKEAEEERQKKTLKNDAAVASSFLEAQ